MYLALHGKQADLTQCICPAKLVKTVNFGSDWESELFPAYNEAKDFIELVDLWDDQITPEGFYYSEAFTVRGGYVVIYVPKDTELIQIIKSKRYLRNTLDIHSLRVVKYTLDC